MKKKIGIMLVGIVSIGVITSGIIYITHHNRVKNTETAVLTEEGTKTEIPTERNVEAENIKYPLPTLIFQGKEYTSLNKDISDEITCGTMDGTIQSFVDVTQIPTEELQSNFGYEGAGVQRYDNSHIVVLIDGNYILYQENKNLGITFSAANLTKMGITIVCNQSGGEPAEELQTGDEFWLECYDGTTWKEVPPQSEIGFKDFAYRVAENEKTEWDCDWGPGYGKLEAGKYRIGKQIMDFRGSGDYSKYNYYVEFEMDGQKNVVIENNQSSVYEGRAGDYNIRMLISRKNDSLAAYYVTQNEEEEIRLDGIFDSKTGKFELYNKNEKIRFTGETKENTPEGELLEGTCTFHTFKESEFSMVLGWGFRSEDRDALYDDFLGYDTQEAEQFAATIKEYTKNNDKEKMAKIIRYPITVTIDGKKVEISKEEKFIQEYEKIFCGKFKQDILNAYTKYLWGNYMGIEINDGLIWFYDNQIYAINN